MNRFCYENRGLLVALPLLYALLSFRYRIEPTVMIWSFGIGIFFLGFLVRLWCQQHLHYRLNVDRSLTATGPYVLMRNPVYVGNTLICLGAVAMSGLLWMLPVTLLWCGILYDRVVRHEETMLEDDYGEPYLEFKQKINRWWPDFSRLDELKGSFINQYFWSSLRSEAHNLLIPVIFLYKDHLPDLYESIV